MEGGKYPTIGSRRTRQSRATDVYVINPNMQGDQQGGYVISWIYRIVIDNIRREIDPGDSCTIHRDVDHSTEIIETGEVLDFFSPPRKDYL